MSEDTRLRRVMGNIKHFNPDLAFLNRSWSSDLTWSREKGKKQSTVSYARQAVRFGGYCASFPNSSRSWSCPRVLNRVDAGLDVG